MASSSTSPPQAEPPGEPLSRTPLSLEDNPTGRPPHPLTSSRFIPNAEPSKQKTFRGVAFLQGPQSLRPMPILAEPTARELDTAAQPPSPHSRQPLRGDTRPNIASCENLGPAPAAAATRTEVSRPSDASILVSPSVDVSKRIPPRHPRRMRRSGRHVRAPRSEPAPALMTQAGPSQGSAAKPFFSEAGVRNQRFFSGQRFRWPSPVPDKPSRASIPAANAEPAGSRPETSRRASVLEPSRRASVLAPQPRHIYHNHAPRLERMSMEESLDESRDPSSPSLSETPTLPCSLGSPAPATIPRRTKSDPGRRSESATPSPVRPLSDILPLKRSMYDGSASPCSTGSAIEVLFVGRSGSSGGVTTPCPARSVSSAQHTGRSRPSRSQQTQLVWPRCPFLPESEIHAPKAAPRFYPPMSPGTWNATVGSRKERQGKRQSAIQPLLTLPREDGPGDGPEGPVVRLSRRPSARERHQPDEDPRAGLSGKARGDVPKEPPPGLGQSVESLVLDLEEKPGVKLPRAQDSWPSFAQEDRGSYGYSLASLAEKAAEALPGQEPQQQPLDSIAWEESRAEGYVHSKFEFEYQAEAEQRVESDSASLEQHTQSVLNMELDDHLEPGQPTEAEFNMDRQHPGSEDGQTVDSDTEPDEWYTPRVTSEAPTERQLELGPDQPTGSQAEDDVQDALVSSLGTIPGQRTPSEHRTPPEPRSPSKPPTSPKDHGVTGSHSPVEHPTPPRKAAPPKKATPPRKTTPPRKVTPREQDESPSAGLWVKARGKLPAQLPDPGGPSSLRRPVKPESRRSDIN